MPTKSAGSKQSTARRTKTAKKASKKIAAKAGATRARHKAKKDGNDKALREHLLELLRGGGAHVDFEKAIAEMPEQLRGVKPPGCPFTAWALLEHERIAQSDILEFSRDAKHVSPAWPDGYWPRADAPPDDAAWEASANSFRADLKTMQELVSNPATNLLARIPHGDGQTLLREALLVADHNAYHIGQLVLLRRLLGAWTD